MVAAHRALLLRSLRYDKAETFDVGQDLRDVVAWLEHTKVCLIHFVLALFSHAKHAKFSKHHCLRRFGCTQWTPAARYRTLRALHGRQPSARHAPSQHVLRELACVASLVQPQLLFCST